MEQKTDIVFFFNGVNRKKSDKDTESWMTILIAGSPLFSVGGKWNSGNDGRANIDSILLE
jgi:hypothetical protein